MYTGKKFTDLYYFIYFFSFPFFLRFIVPRSSSSFSKYSYIYGENVQDAIKAAYRAQGNLAPLPLRRSFLKEDYSWLPPSPGGRTLRSSFLSCLSASSSRNAIIILSYDNGVISRSGAPKKNVESRGAKIHEAKMPARKLT